MVPVVFPERVEDGVGLQAQQIRIAVLHRLSEVFKGFILITQGGPDIGRC